RYPLAGASPTPRPRTPVGALVVTAGHEIVARSSEHEGGVALSLAGTTLHDRGGPTGFPVCERGERVAAAQLLPRPHLFARDGVDGGVAAAALPARFLAARCAGPVVATVDATGTLRLARAGDKAAWGSLPGVGTAFALADLDDVGALELVAAGFRPPGAGDALGFYKIGADGTARPLRKPSPTTAGVVALAPRDFHGDRPIDVVAAIRTADPGRSDLWLPRC